MKRAAIGLRMHSGWGALVAVSNNNGVVEIVDRRRIVVAASKTPGANQPYHFAKNLFAKNLALAEAETFLASSFSASQQLALSSLRTAADELRNLKYQLTDAAVIMASGRQLPPLAKILASHAMIHTAEGEFFRQVVWKACESLGLTVVGLRERDLEDHAQKAFGKKAPQIQEQVSASGRALGPPWTTDQKTAALAALVVLAK